MIFLETSLCFLWEIVTSSKITLLKSIKDDQKISVDRFVKYSYGPKACGHRCTQGGEGGEEGAPHVPPIKIFEKLPLKNAIKHDPP